MLYSGQEASTRYVDFSNQKFLNPAENDAGKEIMEKLRAFRATLKMGTSVMDEVRSGARY